ncbi:hypothetical protein ACGFNU_46210 [Spirillospora sp. NPDC048911]|uniref:hypothetical protein n=1 Tax=Spirillospora sp. NPDC048911 TaxID=3364527 RepID=UPI003720FECB
MFELSARSPLVLPWATLKLAARFALPLALWFTVGELLRYGAMYGGYKAGQGKGVIATVTPLLTIGVLVMISLAITVAMVHCVREGLDVVHAREADGDLTPWAVGNDESAIDALNRAVLPFVIFYLAWGMMRDDAVEFADAAVSRGIAEGGIQGATEALGLAIEVGEHMKLAIGLTIGFIVLKILGEWLLRDRLRRVSGLLLAFIEINFALAALFTIEHVRGEIGDWITQREVWRWITEVAGDVLALWPSFKHAVLGGLIWLVIAGVILGLDATDEEVVLGQSRTARRLARASGLARTGGSRAEGFRELVTRGFREMWLPAWYGLRLVRRSGLVPFATFAALFTGLDVGEVMTRRQIYELMGPHDASWWAVSLPFVGFGTGMVFEALRICLLAAAFNLVVTRVMVQTAAKAGAPPASQAPAAPGSPASPSPPWSGAPSPGR